MQLIEYQVLRVKPKDLETALNETTAQGWQVLSVVAAEYEGTRWGFRQTLDVTRYHIVLQREKQ